MNNLWDKTTFGRTGLRVSRLGIASSFGLSTADVERAFERGINYFYWGSMRRPAFGRGVRALATQHREDMVVVLQSYTRVAALMPRALESGLRRLHIDYADLLLLGWWNDMPKEPILDAARKLVESGKARHIMISCHHRPSFQRFIADPMFGAIMVRYNAAHPGAEAEVFPLLGASPPGVSSYTATRWGHLLDPKHTPPGEATPTATDCYRFVLSNPHVHVCNCGPANTAQLDQAMAALDAGPMNDEELAWMRRVGAAVHDSAMSPLFDRGLALVERLMGKPKQH